MNAWSAANGLRASQFAPCGEGGRKDINIDAPQQLLCGNGNPRSAFHIFSFPAPILFSCFQPQFDRAAPALTEPVAHREPTAALSQGPGSL
jgi:hypothetical protein